MISYNKTLQASSGSSFISDEILEFHAARLLVLISLCGVGDRKRKVPRIKGLTKLAKLDFFVRYPEYFLTAAQFLEKKVILKNTENESKMVRHHYGPWDERYYQVLPYLESRNLIEILKVDNAYQFYLTKLGKEVSEQIIKKDSFQDLVITIKEVNRVFKSFSGNKIKELIYDLFEDEVSLKERGKTI